MGRNFIVQRNRKGGPACCRNYPKEEGEREKKVYSKKRNESERTAKRDGLGYSSLPVILFGIDSTEYAQRCILLLLPLR